MANGGKLIQPRLVLRVNSPHPLGQAQNRIIPPKIVSDLNLKPETVSLLHDAMLADVEDRDGSGRASRVRGISIGGKTGTAQKKVPTGKFHPRTGIRLYRTDHITWFVSFAPVEAPRYSVVVMVESGESGGTTCAPIAGRIYRAIQEIERNAKEGGPRLAKRWLSCVSL